MIWGFPFRSSSVTESPLQHQVNMHNASLNASCQHVSQLLGKSCGCKEIGEIHALCLAMATNPFFLFLKALFILPGLMQVHHCGAGEQHEEMFERSKAGEEEKSTSLGSDDCWRLTAAACYSKFMPATC